VITIAGILLTIGSLVGTARTEVPALRHLAQTAAAAALPATPQGKQLEAFVKALRSGEAAFVTFQAENMLPKRTPEQQKTMYARIRKEFGDFTILRVLSASAGRISVAVKHPAGMNAVFTFAFEAPAPYRITEMNVEVNQQ
jgi:hypothetical protein